MAFGRLSVFTVLLLILLLITQVRAARKGGRRGRKGKNLFPFANAAAYSLIGSTGEGDPKAAKLIRASHFLYSYMLGGKIWLVCASEGDPRPSIVWYKEGVELILKTNTHIYERSHATNQTWSKIEIDPGTLGDSGIYTCYASNEHGMMYKNFKAEPTM